MRSRRSIMSEARGSLPGCPEVFMWLISEIHV
jgi:hypothetical protein